MRWWGEVGAPWGQRSASLPWPQQLALPPNSHSPFCKTKLLHLPLPAFFKGVLGEDLLIL